MSRPSSLRSPLFTHRPSHPSAKLTASCKQNSQHFLYASLYLVLHVCPTMETFRKGRRGRKVPARRRETLHVPGACTHTASFVLRKNPVWWAVLAPLNRLRKRVLRLSDLYKVTYLNRWQSQDLRQVD